jgi:hypothetical protein
MGNHLSLRYFRCACDMTASSYCLVSSNKKGHPCPEKTFAIDTPLTPEPHALFPFKAAPLRTAYITALPSLSCFCPPSNSCTGCGVILRHLLLKVKVMANLSTPRRSVGITSTHLASSVQTA